MKRKSASQKSERIGEPKKFKFKTEQPRIGLFDHIKHIQYVRDPNYYKNLSEDDKKTFNVFMILRGLSMNPRFLDYAAFLYKYLYPEPIPTDQFYTLLIRLYPKHKPGEFYRWIKSKKEKKAGDVKSLYEIVAERLEVSKKEAKDYIKIFKSSKEGKSKLLDVVTGMGYTEKEAKELL